MRIKILVFLAFFATGCGPAADPNTPPEFVLVPAGGQITLDGKPFAGAVITFLPEDSTLGTICSADTDEDGEYELAYRDVPGASAANYKIAVSYKLGRDGKPLDRSKRLNITRENGAHLANEMVPAENSNLGKTVLKATIPPQGGRINFELKGPLLAHIPIPPLPPEDPRPEPKQPAIAEKPAPPTKPVKKPAPPIEPVKR